MCSKDNEYYKDSKVQFFPLINTDSYLSVFTNLLVLPAVNVPSEGWKTCLGPIRLSVSSRLVITVSYHGSSGCVLKQTAKPWITVFPLSGTAFVWCLYLATVLCALFGGRFQDRQSLSPAIEFNLIHIHNCLDVLGPLVKIAQNINMNVVTFTVYYVTQLVVHLNWNLYIGHAKQTTQQIPSHTQNPRWFVEKNHGNEITEVTLSLHSPII